jgi:DNA-binding NarL/FixJ family response regulator
MTAKWRILIADDHDLVREALLQLFDGHPQFEVVAIAVDGEEAVDRASAVNPDIAVVDMSMPRCSGIEATRRIVALCPDTKVIAFSRERSPRVVKTLLACGASGYVLKQSGSGELERALCAVAAGTSHIDPRVSL